MYIYSLDTGAVVKILEPAPADEPFLAHDHAHGFREYITRQYGGGASRRRVNVVRDVSWHPELPMIVATSWCGDSGTAGVVTAHEWRPPAE